MDMGRSSVMSCIQLVTFHCPEMISKHSSKGKGHQEEPCVGCIVQSACHVHVCTVDSVVFEH